MTTIRMSPKKGETTKGCSTFFTLIRGILLGIVMGVGITPAFAVDGIQDKANFPNFFELDGNTQDDNPGMPDLLGILPDDWDYLYDCTLTDSCGDVPYEFTGILYDPAPVTIYTTGGSKDTHDILDWKWKHGSVPDKDDIIHAFAAAYINDIDICYDESGDEVTCGGVYEPLHEEGDLIIYFGLDRFDNSGDAFAGFWFLQNSVGLDDVDMRFTQSHVAKRYLVDEYGVQILDGEGNPIVLRGDVLILVEYPQGSNEVPLIKAYEWDPDLLPPDNLDEDGKSIGPLEMIYDSASNGDSDAECDGYGGKLACAITNKADLTTPPAWDGTDISYLSKDGTNWFPYETFYEGGINLTQLLGGQNICVHTFLAETRSARSETAQLKDFVMGSFELCGSSIRTEVHGADHGDITYTTVMAGTEIHDFAEVEFIVPGASWDTQFDDTGFPKDLGDVVFRLYDGESCGVGVDPQGNPTQADPRTAPWTVTLDGEDLNFANEYEDNLGTAESPLMTLPAASCYSFKAEFISSAPEFFPNTSDHVCETFCIDKYPSQISTQIHQKGTGHAPDIQGESVYVGLTIHDHAYVSVDGDFPGAPTPGGDVTFSLYGNLNCSGTPESATASLGGGEAVSPELTPAGDTFLSFSASYSGDENFEAATDAACEPLEIIKYDSALETEIHAGTGHSPDIQSPTETVPVLTAIHDHAYWKGILDATEPLALDLNSSLPEPTGNVTFNVYKNLACSGEASGTFGGIAWPEIVGLTATSDVSWPYDAETALFTPPAGSLSVKATWSEDANYHGSEAACEPLKINKLSPSIVTKVYVRDLAQVSGGGPVPTGTVTITAYSGDACTGTVVDQETHTLTESDGGAAMNANQQLLELNPDSVSYRAEYSGNDVYDGVIHDCEAVTFSVLPPP